MITTQSALRDLFWESFPEFRSYYRAKKRQNEYPTDIRCAWVEFTDAMQRNGAISEKLAHRATL